MALVAEGVETAEQRDVLKQYGCGLGQGYLFSKPVNAETAREMMARGVV
jgi:EAL domain-containing protein (putative c-di-GMP-specific phosphodiesterase class I)